MNKIPQIQLARAIAALMVVYFHSYMGLRAFEDASAVALPFLTQYGFLGVNLFFIISGFIVGLVTDKPHFSAAQFFIKRVFRIYPIFLLFFGAQVLLAHFDYTMFARLPSSTGEWLANLAIVPMKQEPVYAVAWSLEHELLFYLAAMIVVPLAGVRGLTVVTLLAGIAGQVIKPDWDYHLLSGHQFEFAAGLAIYLVRKRLPTLGVIAPLVVSVAAYAADIYLNVAYASLLAGAALFACLLNLPAGFVEKRLGFLVTIGDASYSLYLGHWLVLGAATVVAWRFPLPAWCAEPYRAAIIAVSVIVSLLVYQCVEKPVIALGHRLAGGAVRQPHPQAQPGQRHFTWPDFRPALAWGAGYVGLFAVLSAVGLSHYKAQLALPVTMDSKEAIALVELVTAARGSRTAIPKTPWGELSVNHGEDGQVVVDVQKVPRVQCINALLLAASQPALIIAAASSRGADERRVPLSEQQAKATCHRAQDNPMRFIFSS